MDNSVHTVEKVNNLVVSQTNSADIVKSRFEGILTAIEETSASLVELSSSIEEVTNVNENLSKQVLALQSAILKYKV